MKIGDIAHKIYVGTVGVATVSGVIYLSAASLATYVQNNQHNFQSGIEVKGIEVAYKGRKPYNPLMPLPNQDRNGHAEVRLRGSELVFLRYDDLTAPSLEGRIMVTNSKGEEAEFNDKAKYDEKTRKEIDKLKDVLGIVDFIRSLSDIIEGEIQEAIARR